MFFLQFGKKIGYEIFVKIEKTECLSNQLTFAHFDQKFIFPIQNQDFVIFIFGISKMFQISGTTTVKLTTSTFPCNSVSTKIATKGY